MSHGVEVQRMTNMAEAWLYYLLGKPKQAIIICRAMEIRYSQLTYNDRMRMAL